MDETKIDYEMDERGFVWAGGYRPALFQIHLGRTAGDPLAVEMVRKANTHDALLAALERLQSRFDALLARHPVRDVAETRAEVEAAIAKAKGGRP